MVDPDILRQVRLFRGLNQDEIDALAEVCGEWECPKGQYVFREGDESDILYVVKSGEFSVLVSTGLLNNHQLCSFCAGEVFGELAFIDRRPRSASIRCTRHAELISLTRDDFRRLSLEHPNIATILYKNICRAMSERLRTANDHMLQLAGRDKSLVGFLPQQFTI